MDLPSADADVPDSRITTRGRGGPPVGTVVAARVVPKVGESRCCDRPQRNPFFAQGGPRNRACRTSEHVTAKQAGALIAAFDEAERIGLPFTRHWTIHTERAGVESIDGAAFVGRILRLASAQARRDGGAVVALWVREAGDGKGEHVHIMLSLPPGMTLARGRTRRWIVAACGQYRARVSKVVGIRGDTANRRNVLRYLQKGTDHATGRALDLRRCGEAGRIIGKRAGFTANLGPAARCRPGEHEAGARSATTLKKVAKEKPDTEKGAG